MHSGEYNACYITLSVYPHRGSLKNMPGHGGNRAYDLCNTSPMLCRLSYAVRSVRVCDILHTKNHITWGQRHFNILFNQGVTLIEEH